MIMNAYVYYHIDPITQDVFNVKNWRELKEALS